jgi:hypothetical protein
VQLPINETDWLTGIASVPNQVRQFMSNHGIEDDARTIVESIRERFPAGSGIDIRVDDDPEGGGEWLVIDVSNRAAPVDEVLHGYDAFLTDWLTTASPTADHLIRVTLNLS